MPISIACSCGAKLKAPDTAAGKRVKCPKCGDPVAVPAAEAEYEEVDDEPAPPPAKRKPQLLDDDEPTPARRRKAEPMEVHEAVDDDDDDDDDDRPKKKGKRGKRRKEEKPKSNLPLILGIGGGVFALLTVVGIVVGVMMSGSGGSAKGTNPGGSPQAPLPPPLPAGWKTFSGEGFNVGIPNDLQFALQPTPPRPPNATSVTEVKGYTGMVLPTQPKQSPLIYVAGVTTLPPEEVAKIGNDPQKMWEEVRSKAGAGGAKLSDEKVIRVGGVEGRQYVVDQGFLTGPIRVILKGSKVYQWGVLGEKSLTEDDPRVKPFLESFKIE